MEEISQENLVEKYIISDDDLNFHDDFEIVVP